LRQGSQHGFDVIWPTDVAGREEKKIKERVNSKKLVEAINKNRAIYPHTKRGQSRLKSGKIDEVSPRYGVGVYIKKEAIINYLKRNQSFQFINQKNG